MSGLYATIGVSSQPNTTSYILVVLLLHRTYSHLPLGYRCINRLVVFIQGELRNGYMTAF
jgi:hypothetical protein